MNFEVMVNTARMKSKEQCLKFTGAIKNNKSEGFKSSIRCVNESELADIIRTGYTIIPAILDESQPIIGKHFKYQQLFGLDFDNKSPVNEVEMAEEAYYMTYDRIMDICHKHGICPVIVYETFSSKPEWKKYRALFVTETPIYDREIRRSFIESLMKLFAVNGSFTADSKCIDEGRIFYAGHTVIAVHQNVPVDIDMVVNAAKNIMINDAAKKVCCENQPCESRAAANDMIDAIINKDIETYTELLSEAVLKAAKADVDWLESQSTKDRTIICKYLLKDYCPEITWEPSNASVASLCGDVFELTSYLPLDIMLGLPYGKSFSCVLPQHDDETPSATINQLDDGRLVYNCWGCMREGQYLDVLDVFSILMNAEVGEAIKFILTAIELRVETEWQKAQREMIDNNIRYINSGYFKKRFSVLHKELVNAKAFGQLIFFLNYAKEHLTPTSLTRDDRPTFFLSIRKASQLMKESGYSGLSKDAINKKNLMLCMLGFFDKLTVQEIPADILRRAISVAQKNATDNGIRYNYRQDFFHIPAYTSKMFIVADEFITTNRKNGVRRSWQSREQILRAYGKDAADGLYTQDTHKEHTLVSIKFYRKYNEAARNLMASYGITSETEILKQIRGYSAEEKKQLSGQCLPQLIMENRYERIRVNKESRVKYHISDYYKSGSYIIIRNTDAKAKQKAV